MYGKAALAFVCVVVLLVTCSFFVGTVDLRSQFFPLLQPQASDHLACAPSGAAARAHPLRVYVYELPRRFHIGMLHGSRPGDDEPVTSRNLPPWPGNSGLKQQHSVEYWMMASLLYGGEEDWREAIRVSDPETADVFFVPFFSSLSFNTHGHNMTDPDTEIDKKLQAEVVHLLWKSKYWQRSKGRDHVIPMHHPNAFRFHRGQVNASILIVADFGRYSKTMSNLNKDVVAPYVHVVDSYTDDNFLDPFESRLTLLFFRGRTVRKAEGVVRAKLGKILVGYDDVHYEESHATTENIKLSTEGMRASKFCLHAAGDTPSSCRLFDAIVSHCVPVIVSDQLELPYEDELDYMEFSIFFSFEEALKPGYMVEQLRKISKEKWFEMWRRLKEISHHYEFQYPPKKEDAVNMIWRQVKHKLPGANLAVHRSQRLKIPDWWRRRR